MKIFKNKLECNMSSCEAKRSGNYSSFLSRIFLLTIFFFYTYKAQTHPNPVKEKESQREIEIEIDNLKIREPIPNATYKVSTKGMQKLGNMQNNSSAYIARVKIIFDKDVMKVNYVDLKKGYLTYSFKKCLNKEQKRHIPYMANRYFLDRYGESTLSRDLLDDIPIVYHGTNKELEVDILRELTVQIKNSKNSITCFLPRNTLKSTPLEETKIETYNLELKELLENQLEKFLSSIKEGEFERWIEGKRIPVEVNDPKIVISNKIGRPHLIPDCSVVKKNFSNDPSLQIEHREKVKSQTEGHCYIRAHHMSGIMLNYNYEPLKIWAYLLPTEDIENPKFHYHVATMIQCKTEKDKREFLVWDPWYGNKKGFTSLEKWLKESLVQPVYKISITSHYSFLSPLNMNTGEDRGLVYDNHLCHEDFSDSEINTKLLNYLMDLRRDVEGAGEFNLKKCPQNKSKWGTEKKYKKRKREDIDNTKNGDNRSDRKKRRKIVTGQHSFM